MVEFRSSATVEKFTTRETIGYKAEKKRVVGAFLGRTSAGRRTDF
jgi:hypothetical protein